MTNPEFLEAIKSGSLKVLAKPNSPKSEMLGFVESKKAWRIALKARPEDGKANEELVRFLHKEYKVRFEIISGFTSKEKLLKRRD